MEPAAAMPGTATERRLRLAVVAVLVLSTVVGYADRQVLGLLKPVLDGRFGWTSSQYGTISAAFQVAVAIGLLGAGWCVDRVGPRFALAVGLAGWSAFAVAHALARTVEQFVVLRAGLGLFEAVGTPAAMAAVSALFPWQARGRLIGLLNAVPNGAAMLTPVLVGVLFPLVGWTGTVALIGAGGFVLAAIWLRLRLHRLAPSRVGPDAPADTERVHAGTLAVWRMVAAFSLGKALTDPVWWFMLSWLPDLLHRRFGLDLSRLPLPLVCIYAAAAAGSLLAGAAAARLRRGGLEGERARRRVLAASAAAVLPLPLCLAPSVGLWGTVALIGLALAGHQGFATSLFGFIAERSPRARIGRVAGAGAFCGNVAGAAALWGAGRLLGHPGGLAAILVYAALAYAVAAAAFAALVPSGRGATEPRSLPPPDAPWH